MNMEQKPNEALAKELEHRKNVLESDEMDDDENRVLTAEAARKEDQTMEGAKLLKECEEKGERLGASTFWVAKKMACGEKSKEDLRDDIECEEGPTENN